MKVIAISGLPGSGSTTVSKKLASVLNLHHFSPGRVFKDAGRGMLQQQFYYPLFFKICNSKQIQFELLHAQDDSHAVVSLWDSEMGKSKSFHEAIDDLQKALAQEGNIVIDGKLSLHMLPQAECKVWLTASRDTRAMRSARRDGLSLEEAQTLIPQREHIEASEWKKIYAFDYRDQQSLASIVIDTTHLTPDQVVETIVNRIKDKL